MTFHLLTAVTRPENLGRIAESIAASGVDIHWHLRFDPEKEHVGGQALKNAMLDEIPDGWVYILDDDTVLHPDLLRRVSGVNAGAVVVSQARGGQVASSRHLAVGGIDAGQAVLRREFIGDARLPLAYDGDGRFLVNLLQGEKNVVFLDEVLCYYNALRGGS